MRTRRSFSIWSRFHLHVIPSRISEGIVVFLACGSGNNETDKIEQEALLLIPLDSLQLLGWPHIKT